MRQNSSALLEREQWCYDALRHLLWPEGITCLRCKGSSVAVYSISPETPRRRYHCQGCGLMFTDLSGTPFAHTNLPLSIWCFYLRLRSQGLGTSDIARELGVKWDTVTYLEQRIARAESQPGIVGKLRDAVQGIW